MSDSTEKNTARVAKFRDDRDWKQFHNPKDMAISLSLEASEVLEHFQWKDPAEVERYIESNREDVAEELADVYYWVLLMCEQLGINLGEALDRKLDKNEVKYPVDKAKGNHKKYSEL